MTFRNLFFTMGISLALLSPVFAEDSTTYSRPGFYAGIGGLYAIENFDVDTGVEVDNAPGFNFRLGYRIIPNFAIEAMGERVDNFELKNAVGLEVDTWTGTLNGKVFFLTHRFQPYGLLGLGIMRFYAKLRQGFGSNETETDLAIRYGGGLDSYITENWVANLEITYVLPTGDVKDVDYFSFGGGIQYRF